MKTIKNTILNHILRSVQRNIEVIDEYLMSNIDNYRSDDQDSIVRLLFDTKNNIDCLNSLLNKGRKINKQRKRSMTIEEEFFNKLYEVFDVGFPKGEKCKCGKKLSCRIRALMLNTYANLFFIEMKEKWQEELIEKIKKIEKYDDLVECENLVKYEDLINEKNKKIGELILREDVLNLLKDNKIYETKQKML